jgi:hypothetical protein
MPDQPAEIQQRIADILAGFTTQDGLYAPTSDDVDELAKQFVSALGLTREQTNHPVWVQDYDEDGNPLMHEEMVLPHPKMHCEFVPKSRYVTEWVPDVP